MPTDEVLATIRPSAPRRAFGLGVLLLLGALLAYLAFALPGLAMVMRLFLLALGALVLWIAARMGQVTRTGLELTREALRDSTGQVLAPLSEISGVERGTFAFKPSNGFLIRLKTRQPRAWAPGLWWRMGRRIGVGGVTAAADAKAMAEIITALLIERGEVD